MARMGKAAQEAREGELVAMTLEKAARILEGLLSNPMRPARRKRRHPVSLSRRRKRKGKK